MADVFLGIDPGETTGWCLFVDNQLNCFGQIPDSSEGLTRWGMENASLLNLVTVCVYEDYKIRGNKALAHIGSRVPTIQCIGVVKHWGILGDWKMICQPSSILPIAQKWSQVKIPTSDHSISHQYVAINHVLYYMIGKDIIPSALESEQ
jgi:hypothetical protein